MRVLPRTAWLLGFAGLLPFIILTAAILLGWSLPGLAGARLDWWLAAYASIILSFLGAVHWGVALGMQTWLSEKDIGYLLKYSVTPGLLAWFALLLPIKTSLISMTILLISAYFVDRWLLYSRIELMNTDYLRLRRYLTLVAASLTFLAALSV